MRIGILGTGDVGQSLAEGFVKAGHDVMLGSRDPANAAKLVPNARGGTSAEAARHGEVIVVATVWTGAENAVRLAGHENFAGKVVLDVTNPLDFSEGMPPRLSLGHTDSCGETLQRWLPKARVVKTLNIVNHRTMIEPKLWSSPTMFVCGNDEEAKRVATDLLRGFGWEEVLDIGGIAGARLMEPLCLLWVHVGVLTGEWTHAFKLVHRQ